MVSLPHEKASEIGRKYFVWCHTPWLKDVIFAVTNIAVEFNDLF